MNVGHFILDEPACDDIPVFAKSSSQREKLPAMGMTPPAAPPLFSEEGVSHVDENGMVSRFKDNPMVVDKCERLNKSHIRKKHKSESVTSRVSGGENHDKGS